MAFNELNTVEHFIIQKLSGVNLNAPPPVSGRVGMPAAPHYGTEALKNNRYVITNQYAVTALETKIPGILLLINGIPLPDARKCRKFSARPCSNTSSTKTTSCSTGPMDTLNSITEPTHYAEKNRRRTYGIE